LKAREHAGARERVTAIPEQHGACEHVRTFAARERKRERAPLNSERGGGAVCWFFFLPSKK